MTQCYVGWTEADDLIVNGMYRTIADRAVTENFHPMMEGAATLKCSESGHTLIKHM